MSSRRQSLFLEYAEVTARLRMVAEAGELSELSLLLAARQRLIEECRRFDASEEPLTVRERRALEQALCDERATRDQLAQRRQRFVQIFRELAKTRRAHGGYTSQAVNAPTLLDRRA